MEGGPVWSPFRLVGILLSGESIIRPVEELQLIQKANSIPSRKESIAGENLFLICAVDTGFDLNHDDGNVAVILAAQDGTTGKDKIKRAAFLSCRKVEVENSPSIFHVNFGRNLSAHTRRRRPGSNRDWSPKIRRFGLRHPYWLKYRISRLCCLTSHSGGKAINPGSARAEPSQHGERFSLSIWSRLGTPASGSALEHMAVMQEAIEHRAHRRNIP